MGRLNDFLTHFKVEIGDVTTPAEALSGAVGRVSLTGQIEGVVLPDLVETSIQWNNNSPMVEEIPTGMEAMQMEVISAARADFERLFGTEASWTFTGGDRQTPTAGERYSYLIERYWALGRLSAIRNSGQIQAGQINTKTIRSNLDRLHIDKELAPGQIFRLVEVDIINDPPLLVVNPGLTVGPHSDSADTRQLIDLGASTLIASGAVNLWAGIFR